MVILSFISMYVLMYAMVDAFDNVYNNVNQVYMAGLMTAPMLILELLLMNAMYKNKKLNMELVVGGVVLLTSCFLLIRSQAAVADRQFIRSMIPHHASALLMCKEASLQDPELQALCRNILAGQQAEINQMNAILERLDKE